MKKLFIATSIVFALSISATNGALANTSNKASLAKQTDDIKKEETKNDLIGFGSGAVAGAIVGGPVGAVVGGIFGLFIADDVNGDAQLDRTHNELAQTKHTLKQQQQSVLALQSELQNLHEQQMVQLVSYEQESNDNWLNDLSHFETNLQFKTASFNVEESYKNQLDSLAGILSTYPQLNVQVTGYADQRGDSDYNQQLSQQRAEAVAAYLSLKNVKANQIKIVAAGEIDQAQASFNALSSADHSATLTPKVDIEDLFFARRVNISLLTPKEQMTAAN